MQTGSQLTHASLWIARARLAPSRGPFRPQYGFGAGPATTMLIRAAAPLSETSVLPSSAPSAELAQGPSWCSQSYDTRVECYNFNVDFENLQAQYGEMRTEMEDEFINWLTFDPGTDAFSAFLSALADGMADAADWLLEQYGTISTFMDMVNVYNLVATYNALTTDAWVGSSLGVWGPNSNGGDWYIDCTDPWYWANSDVCDDYFAIYTG